MSSVASSATIVVDTTTTRRSHYGGKDMDDNTESTATETISTSFSGRTLMESPPWKNTEMGTAVEKLLPTPKGHNANEPEESPRFPRYLYACPGKTDDQSACTTQPNAHITATQLHVFRDKF